MSHTAPYQLDLFEPPLGPIESGSCVTRPNCPRKVFVMVGDAGKLSYRCADPTCTKWAPYRPQNSR